MTFPLQQLLEQYRRFGLLIQVILLTYSPGARQRAEPGQSAESVPYSAARFWKNDSVDSIQY